MINTVPGWIQERELDALHSLCLPYNYIGSIGVEIGSAHGRSSYTIAKAIPLGSLFCIDMWRGEPTYEGEKYTNEERTQHNYPGTECYNTLEFFKENIRDCPNITPIRGLSPKIVSDWTDPIDLFFLDASHSNPWDRDNIDFWVPKIKPSGIIIGHDLYDNDYFPDIRENVRYLEGRLNQTVLTFPGASVWAINVG